jgi:hypothetical protein
MHFLSIQVQPNLLATFNEHAIEQLRSLDAPEGSVQEVEVQRGENNGPYVNVTFTTPDPKLLWPTLRERLVRLGLQGASIATCTGSRGWDNYLLLHHFSRDVPNERFGAP